LPKNPSSSALLHDIIATDFYILMTQILEMGNLSAKETAAKLDILRKLGQYQIVCISDHSIGIIDPTDLIDDDEPRLLASFDLRRSRELIELFSILIGPAMFITANNTDFVLGKDAHPQSSSGD